MSMTSTGRLWRAALFALAVVACLLACACSSEKPADGEPVAASLLGHDITEAEVTEYIRTFRSGIQCNDDADWADYLEERDLTPADVRKTTIYELAASVVVRNKAEELGLEADQASVDAQVSAMRSSFLAQDDEAWSEQLEKYGMTEERLREGYENKNLEKQVFEKVAEGLVPTDKDIANYVEGNLMGQTVKKLECVYGTAYDRMQGFLDMASASKSAGAAMERISAEVDDVNTQYVDIGWDVSASLSSNMKSAVSKVGKGEFSDTLLSENGTYYLFYVSDSYTFPADVSKMELADPDLKEAVSGLAAGSLVNSAGGVWLQQQIGDSVTINDMPEGLPYDVKPDTGDKGTAEPASSASAAGDESSTDCAASEQGGQR